MNQICRVAVTEPEPKIESIPECPSQQSKPEKAERRGRGKKLFLYTEAKKLGISRASVFRFIRIWETGDLSLRNRIMYGESLEAIYNEVVAARKSKENVSPETLPQEQRLK